MIPARTSPVLRGGLLAQLAAALFGLSTPLVHLAEDHGHAHEVMPAGAHSHPHHHPALHHAHPHAPDLHHRHSH